MLHTIRLTHRIHFGYGYTIKDYTGTLDDLINQFCMYVRMSGETPKTAVALVDIINRMDCKSCACRLSDQLTQKNPDLYTLEK